MWLSGRALVFPGFALLHHKRRKGVKQDEINFTLDITSSGNMPKASHWTKCPLPMFPESFEHHSEEKFCIAMNSHMPLLKVSSFGADSDHLAAKHEVVPSVEVLNTKLTNKTHTVQLHQKPVSEHRKKSSYLKLRTQLRGLHAEAHLMKGKDRTNRSSIFLWPGASNPHLYKAINMLCEC